MSSASNAGRCERTAEVSLYAIGALPAGELPSLRAHLAECRDCQKELDSLRPVIDSFVSWPTDVLRPAQPLWARLAQRIGAETHTDAIAARTRERSEPDWEQVALGISCKVLALDSEHDRVSMLVRLAPGVEYPPHRHAGVEELHLLDGELWINDQKFLAGAYVRAEPGSADQRVWSETGCTCVLITSMRDALR